MNMVGKISDYADQCKGVVFMQIKLTDAKSY
jgi:hypothetical protein